jgi:threonine/homoserine/homoserine lactone efflux protein
MSLAGLLVFSTAYALAVASPGPGIAAVVAQVLGRGWRAAPPQIAGILAGDLV